MKVFVAGTVGVPARYGGWETLVENLVKYHDTQQRPEDFFVYCSVPAYPDAQPAQYYKTNLLYSRWKANGAQSIIYDTVTMLDAVRRGADTIVLLGISGAIALPLIRLISKARIITNIDGIEWRRDKWQGFARWFLKQSERWAVRFSHIVLADNQGIADHVADTYGIDVDVIEYGGNHAIADREAAADVDLKALYDIPDNYAFSLCRIEPENNVHLILEAFSKTDAPLVFVGNWDNSPYGQDLKATYQSCPNIQIIDPTYDPRVLYRLRAQAACYVHGHSAGGTNPSLVEIMFFGCPIFAYDCNFNRYTTEDKALYFRNTSDLQKLISDASDPDTLKTGAALQETAKRRYMWEQIGRKYFELFVNKPRTS